MGGQEKYTGPRKSGIIGQLMPTQGYRIQHSGDDMASAGKGGPVQIPEMGIDPRPLPERIGPEGKNPNSPPVYGPVQIPEMGIDPRPLPERRNAKRAKEIEEWMYRRQGRPPDQVSIGPYEQNQFNPRPYNPDDRASVGK